ncbi:MAG TPA: hypothetical protein VGF12_18975 [Roseateles sp.]|uniref:hypothetical protein n=1 Tax=Roseateles sp. TaxID=1971397 RepID=UPI002ED8C320
MPGDPALVLSTAACVTERRIENQILLEGLAPALRQGLQIDASGLARFFSREAGDDACLSDGGRVA